MDINNMGKEGEFKAKELLKKLGFAYLCQVDFIGFKEGKWYLFEIKNKEYFKAPPFDGHGLNIYQFERRLKFEDDTGIKGYLIIFDNNKIYCQSLINLNNSEFFDTKKDIRIFPLKSFEVI